MMVTLLPPLSLYIHIPWCIQKCPYCDFNSHAIKTDLPESLYVQTLLADLEQDLYKFKINRTISSIFIGGGTPSLFSPEAINRLLIGVAKLITLEPNLEITLEANPGTFESHKFAEFRVLGINRLSIGIQSFNDAHLKKLGRIHDSHQAVAAVEMAQQAGFENFNLDLMFGLPEQTVEQAVIDVKTAIRLNPAHISFYQLTLEPNTYFHRFPPALPGDELIFIAQQACQQLLAEQGYQQYEVSAYSKAGVRCQHNLNYWQFGDYLGIGAGAHGKISLSLPEHIIRTTKPKSPGQYLTSIEPFKNSISGGDLSRHRFKETALIDNTNTDSVKAIAKKELPLEFMMNQLRLKQGFTLAHYEAVTGLSIASLEPALSAALSAGLLIKQQQHYQCSEQGWSFLDIILEKFIY